jgi:cation:H+ antiporter
MYIVKVVKTNKEDKNNSSFVSNPLLKFIACSLVLIAISILLTLQADKITHIYPQVSSSTVGAILLGITTSIPEVVSTFALLKYNNNDMAISNMLGSNIFNFFILALSDFFVRDNHIYHYSDIYSFEYSIGGILLTTLLLISIIKKNKNKLYYLVISLIMSFIYLLVWYFQFK